MKKDTVSVRLTTLAFDFFHWFSCFEFALKENKYLENSFVPVSVNRRSGGHRQQPLQSDPSADMCCVPLRIPFPNFVHEWINRGLPC